MKNYTIVCMAIMALAFSLPAISSSDKDQESAKASSDRLLISPALKTVSEPENESPIGREKTLSKPAAKEGSGGQPFKGTGPAMVRDNPDA